MYKRTMFGLVFAVLVNPVHAQNNHVNNIRNSDIGWLRDQHTNDSSLSAESYSDCYSVELSEISGKNRYGERIIVDYYAVIPVSCNNKNTRNEEQIYSGLVGTMLGNERSMDTLAQGLVNKSLGVDGNFYTNVAKARREAKKMNERLNR